MKPYHSEREEFSPYIIPPTFKVVLGVFFVLATLHKKGAIQTSMIICTYFYSRVFLAILTKVSIQAIFLAQNTVI